MNPHEAGRQPKDSVRHEIDISDMFSGGIKTINNLAAQRTMDAETRKLLGHAKRFNKIAASLYGEGKQLFEPTDVPSLSETGLVFFFHLNLAQRFLLANAIQDFYKAASRTSVGKEINERLEKLKQGDLSILFFQVKEYSLWQLFSEGKKGNPAKQLEFLHEAFLPSESKLRDIDDVKKSIYQLQVEPTSNLKELLQEETIIKLAPQCIPCIKELIKTLQEVRSAILETLLAPKSDQFLSIKRVMEPYLDPNGIKTRESRLSLLLTICSNDSSKAISLYRQTQSFVLQDTEIDFYSKLAQATKEHLLSFPFKEIITIEDLYALFNGEGKDKPKPQQNQDETRKRINVINEESKTLINKIFSLSRTKEYQVAPEAIASLGELTVKQVQVKFDQNNPQGFTLILEFENRFGESMTVTSRIDTKRGNFDWSAIEDSSEAPSLRLKIQSIAYEALQEVYKTAEEQAERRRDNQHREETPTTPVPRKRERNSDPIYALRKASASNNSPTKQAESTPLAKAVEQMQNGIKMTILPTIDPKLFGNISNVDRGIVKEAIEEFNQRGVGYFKMLKEKRGGPLYVLRVSSIGSSGIRVLMRETQAPDGERRFEVFNIGYRKDIYSKSFI